MNTTHETRATLGTARRAAASAAAAAHAAQVETRAIPERARDEWQQLARECLPSLKDTMRRLENEKLLLQEIAQSRGDALGASGRSVLAQEIGRRFSDWNRVFRAHNMVHQIACALDRDELPSLQLQAVQDVAEWFELVELAPTREEVAPPAPPKPRCPHAHIIRRFAQMAELRGCHMDDTNGRRDAFRKWLGRPLESCSELTASEWESGMRALREGKMKW